MRREWRWSIAAVWILVFTIQFVWIDAADPATPGVGPQDTFVVIALVGFVAVIVAAILNWDVTPELASLVAVDALAASVFDVRRAPNLFIPEMTLYAFVLGFSLIAVLGARPRDNIGGRRAWDDRDVAERVNHEGQLAWAVLVLGIAFLGLLNKSGFFSAPEDAEVTDLQAIVGVAACLALGIAIALIGNNLTKRRVLRSGRWRTCAVAVRTVPSGRSSRQVVRLKADGRSFFVAPSAFRQVFERAEDVSFCGDPDSIVILRRQTGQLIIGRAAPFAWLQRRRERAFHSADAIE